MPCCIGIIQFQRCRHSLLLKLGCTNHCEELCPPEMQVGLVSTSYLWLCEDCHERKTNIDLDDRCNKWADLMMDIPECDAQLRIHIEDAVRAREEYEEVTCEKSRVGCIEEIQWVVEWTYEYGIMLYDVLFKKMCEPRKAAARMDDLREMKMHEWDLLVVKDALRNPKVLFEEQLNETYWFINDQSNEQYLLRKQLQQPPVFNRPPVPLFPWKGKEDESRSSESTNTLISEDLDADGDKIIIDSQGEQAHTEHRSATSSSPTERDSHSTTDVTAVRDSSRSDQPGDMALDEWSIEKSSCEPHWPSYTTPAL